MSQEEVETEPSSLWDPVLDRYVLQEVILTSRAVALAPRLYMGDLGGTMRRQAGQLVLEAGAKVGFNTYANSFFASYWEKYTDLRLLSLSGKMQGRGLLHLFRSTPKGTTVKVGEYPVEDVFHIHFDLFSYLPDEGASGRIFFDLEAVTDVTIEQIAFSTFSPPPQTASFSLGICTYRKEEHVSNLVLSLEDYVKRDGTALSEVIVVNNSGDNSDLPVLQAVAKRMPALSLIEQDNIGGAGGFARTLHESLKSQTSTHHIFMDDDVFLDTRMLDRLRAFVSYCRKPQVVGGQMMNMSEPCRLYEGGARLDYWGFLARVGAGVDGSQGQDVSFFDQVHEVDYNAWWFACVPKAEAAQVGLPLNIFIRGDDFEYGLRLGQAGVPTVSLPGLFIWHEAFENKSGAWLHYYDWRNRLIVAAIYNAPAQMDVPPPDVLREAFADAFIDGRSQFAFAQALAVLDFLGGPESVLQQNAETRHNELRQSLERLATGESDIVAELEAVLKASGSAPELKPILGLERSARFNAAQNGDQSTSVISAAVIRVIDDVLARYINEADMVKAEWQKEAHNLSSAACWEQRYGWTPDE